MRFLELELHIATSALVVLATCSTVVAQTQITACHQGHVRGPAVLAGDLDCTATGVPAIEICGELDFAGFTVTGGGHPVLDVAIRCLPGCTCTIRGPGTVAHSESDAIAGSVTVQDMTIHEPAGAGVWGVDRNVRVIDSVIRGCGAPGVFAPRAYVSGSRLSESVVGLLAGRTKLVDSDVSDNIIDGIRTWGRATIEGSTISSNGGHGVDGHVGGPHSLIKVSGSTIANNAGHGIMYGHETKLRDVEILGNGLSGVGPSEQDCGRFRMRRLTIRSSELTGNGTSAECGFSEVCADIDVCDPPRITDSVCTTSHVTESGIPGTSWGVCSAD